MRLYLGERSKVEGGMKGNGRNAAGYTGSPLVPRPTTSPPAQSEKHIWTLTIRFCETIAVLRGNPLLLRRLVWQTNVVHGAGSGAL